MGSGTMQIISFIFEEWLLLIFLTCIFGVYFYYTSTFDHFERKGIPFMKPTIFIGNLGPRLRGAMSFHDFQLNIYNHFKGKPFGGVFEGRNPVLYVLDPELIKAITMKDFEYFVDRNTIRTNEPVYLRQTLVNLQGWEWKGVRSTLTPTFSSARLKNMLPLFEVCTDGMVNFLKQYDGGEIELKGIMGRLTLEIIGACAFGIKTDSLDNENARFVKVAERLTDMSFFKRMTFLFSLILIPDMLKYLNFSMFNTEATDEIVGVLKNSIAERRKGARCNDFLQLLLDAADKENNETSAKVLDDDTIDAQAFLFLIAGYETSSTLLSFAIHTLATNPHVQERLREHIADVTAGRDLHYDTLQRLSYLEGFLLETLRVYPPLSRFDRICTKDYTLPGTSVKIQRGDVVCISVAGTHMDPDIYENPTEIRPERFMQKDKPLFLGFGSGPRNCIGGRFAILSAKLAIVKLIKNFKFSTCPKTDDPIKICKRGVLLKAESGLWVKVDAL